MHILNQLLHSIRQIGYTDKMVLKLINFDVPAKQKGASLACVFMCAHLVGRAVTVT